MPHTIAFGDTHGNWPALLKALWHFRPEVCLVAGDFGWWPRLWDDALLSGREDARLSYLLEKKPAETEIRFIEGNHEDLDHLFAHTHDARRVHEPVELRPKLWYQPRGSTLDLADGRRVFCCGGGKSVDRFFRKEGASWFPQEIVKMRDIPKDLPRCEIVLSHTVPNRLGVLETFPKLDPRCMDTSPDPTCEVLDHVFDAVRPDLWIASHLHVLKRGKVKGTEYVVLDRTDGGLRPWTDFALALVK